MRWPREIRNPSIWLRATLVAFVLGFAVNTAVHAGHAHDPASVFSQHASCGHCVQFGHLADTPCYAHEAPVATGSFRLALPEGDGIDSPAIWLIPKPRGPPLSEIR